MGAITLLRRGIYWGMYYCVALGSYITCFEFNEAIVIRYIRAILRFLGASHTLTSQPTGRPL